MDLADDLYLTNLEWFERRAADVETRTFRKYQEIRGTASGEELVALADNMVAEIEELRRTKDQRDREIERWLIRRPESEDSGQAVSNPPEAARSSPSDRLP